MSERELVRLCGSSKQYGTEPAALIEALEKLGFKVVAKDNGTWEDLEKLVTHGTPVLVNWWSDFEKPHDGHYSIASSVTKNSITLMDPEIGGLRRLGKARFMRQWYDYFVTGGRNERWYLYIAK